MYSHKEMNSFKVYVKADLFFVVFFIKNFYLKKFSRKIIFFLSKHYVVKERLLIFYQKFKKIYIYNLKK